MNIGQILLLVIVVLALAFLDKNLDKKREEIVAPKIEKEEVQVRKLTPNELLINEGKRIGVLSLKGEPNAILQRFCNDHAAFQAVTFVQGHQQWNERYGALSRLLPGLRFTEVANESWPGQSAEDAAVEMFRSWRHSSGHWAAVNGECKVYGYAMVLGKNGVWYACGIFGK